MKTKMDEMVDELTKQAREAKKQEAEETKTMALAIMDNLELGLLKDFLEDFSRQEEIHLMELSDFLNQDIMKVIEEAKLMENWFSYLRMNTREES